MKKLLRPLVILLLLALGFLYLVKNPELPISEKILTTIGLDMSTDEGTGLDLTNCISYFDGCNNCTVENGKPSACTLMYCETPGEPKCNEYSTGTVPGSVGIANPASTNCINNGGTLEIVTQSDGGQVGMCTLSDGTICEERAYMRGECKAKEEATACTMEYAPVCALVHVQCIKAPCEPIQQTFGNRCMMNANSLAEYLYDGECRTGGEDLSNCVSYYDGCNTCGVENGKVTMCTEMYCETPGEAKCLKYK